MANTKYRLISHHLCPFVQRAAIAFEENGVPVERVNIDLVNKPDWFLELSPLGKVPVLVVDEETVLFESSVIAQYVDEVTGGHLLATDPAEKARQKAWMEFASTVIGNIGQLNSARTRGAYDKAREELADKWRILEANLAAGPWFAGDRFTLVDAAFAPVFRYFEVIESIADDDFFPGVPKVAAWRRRLAARTSVKSAVGPDYHERLLESFAGRDSVIGKLSRQTPSDKAA
jgi:glutathione S-transferase